MSLICYEFTIFVVTNMSLICTTGALNPRGHYVSGMGPGQLNTLRNAFERMIYRHSGIITIRGANFLCKCWFFLKLHRPENDG
jgi:hypothetical protein